MNGVNKVILIGYVGNAPDVRSTASQKTLVNLSLATSESWKNKDTGERDTKTEWHKIIFFDPLSNVVSRFVQKGSLIYVEGKLQTRFWIDKEGNKKYTTEVIAQNMQMLNNKRNAADSLGSGIAAEDNNFNDDIPF